MGFESFQTKIDFFPLSLFLSDSFYRTQFDHLSRLWSGWRWRNEKEAEGVSEHLKIITVRWRGLQQWEKIAGNEMKLAIWKCSCVCWSRIEHEKLESVHNVCLKRVGDKYLIMEMIFNSILQYVEVGRDWRRTTELSSVIQTRMKKKCIKCRIKCSESRVIQTYEFSLKFALFCVPCYSICRLHDAAPNAAIIISDCIKQGSERIGFNSHWNENERFSSFHAKI